MAASYYWLPHFTGRMPSKHLGKVAFWLVFVGFHLTFLPMHLTGLAGMPRRVHTYPADMGWDLLNLMSSLGGFIQAIGFAVFVIDVLLHARIGARAPRNPWGAGTLEWATPIPAPSYNFGSIPDVPRLDPLWERPSLPDEMARGKFWLGEPSGGRRLTLSSEMISARPECVIVLPGSSWWPLAAAIATGGFFLCVLLKVYALALGSLVAAIALFLFWAWSTGSRIDAGRLKAHDDVSLPLHFEHSAGAPGWHGSVYTLIADAAVLASLVFGAVYLWALASGWPPAVYSVVSPWAVAAGALCGVLSWWGVRMARRYLTSASRHRDFTPNAWLGLHAIALFGLLTVLGLALAGLQPASSHAQSAVTAALLWYGTIHVAIALLMSLFLLVRWRSGFVSARRDLEPRVVWLFGHYGWGSALLCLVLAAAPAMLA